MAEDVWTALVKGVLAFGQTRAASLVATSFHDTGAFVGSLGDGATGSTKLALEQLKQDIRDLKPEVKALVDAVKPKIEEAAAAAGRAANALGESPFTLEAAARVATDLASVLIAGDAALVIVAEKVSKKGTPDYRDDVFQAIVGITEPWKAPFRSFGAGLTGAFDAAAQQLLGEGDAARKLGQAVTLDRVAKRLEMKLGATGERQPVGGFPAFQLDDTQLVAFLSYAGDAVAGVKLKTRLKAGLRSDKLLEKVIPGGAPSSDTDYTTVTLDSDKGLTFGDGKSKSLLLPARFSYPGIELRELILVLPEESGPSEGRIELKATVAGKLGDVVGLVVEGAGIVVTFRSGGGAPIGALPRLPDAAGFRIDTPVVKGGGYLFQKDGEYGGILDLRFTEIGVTAIGLVQTDPFALVLVISVHFLPKIELGFGFTLNGLGGLIALERRANTDALRKGIRDGTAAMLLFPENPIDAAPTILQKLRDAFPPDPGSFVVGPIAKLGWGSQAGFVVAKLGVVLSLPDPKLILLGALEIGVPSAEVKPELRIVDLRAELYGELTPDYVLLLVGLSNSKVAGIPISGDLGLLVRWAGGADFALAVGGFHPRYEGPPELAGLRRIQVDLSPSAIDFLRITAKGYFALTANSIQFGGGIWIKAELGPAEGEAWFVVNALFVWAPRFFFEADVDCGISVKVFGKSFAGVRFEGLLRGTTPWMVRGTATIDLGLFGSYDFDLGPIRWGEVDESVAATVSPLEIVAEALRGEASFVPRLPGGGDALVRLRRDETTPLLVHPLGQLEIKQGKLPLETTIDRVGSSRVSAHRVNLTAPTVGGAPAAAVSTLEESFALGHFVDLTRDEQVSLPDFALRPSGMRLAASAAPLHGKALATAYVWETSFPHEDGFETTTGIMKLSAVARLALRSSAVAVKARERANPYLGRPPAPIRLRDPGLVELRRRDDGARVAGTATLAIAEAFVLRRELAAQGGAELELVAAGTTR